jgi:hypothetical protein
MRIPKVAITSLEADVTPVTVDILSEVVIAFAMTDSGTGSSW